jgi:epoxide hydrolase
MSDIRRAPIAISEADLTSLRCRIAETRWIERETVEDWSQGPPLAAMRALMEYWSAHYDWRQCEARINALNPCATEIDGLDIHFLHARSPHAEALPLVITHGWPGSVAEFLDVIPMLTNPTAFGGRAEDAFHIVAPSLPGYGFSGKPQTAGWKADRIAHAWIELMGRLGYGGRWGRRAATGARSSPR